MYEWLRDTALVSLDDIPPVRGNIEKHLGPYSPSYHRDIDTLRNLFAESAHYETIKVKRRLWYDLLRAALGEIAGDDAQMDDLFVRHTYLTAVVRMVVQASFGIDIRALAETELKPIWFSGREFRQRDRLAGRSGIRFLCLAHRSVWLAAAQSGRAPRGAIRLASKRHTERYRRNTV